MVREVLGVLSQEQVDPLLTLTLLARASAIGPAQQVVGKILGTFNNSQLYRLYENLKANDAMFSVLEDFGVELAFLGGSDPQIVGFQRLLSSIKTNLDETWNKTLQHLGERGFETHPDRSSGSQRHQVEAVLRSTFAKILKGKTNPAQILEMELSRLRSEGRKGAQKVRDQIISVRTELMAQGTVNRELLQALLTASLVRAGHDPAETTAREAIEESVKLRMADRRPLVGTLLTALRKDVDGEDYEGELLAAISKIEEAANSPELKPPAGFSDLWECSTPQEAADAIHDVARQFSEPKHERMFKTLVQDHLQSSSGFTWKGARQFLKILDQVTLTGKSKLVRDAIAEYVAWPRS